MKEESRDEYRARRDTEYDIKRAFLAVSRRRLIAFTMMTTRRDLTIPTPLNRSVKDK